MILSCSDWLLVRSGPPHSQELGVAGPSSSFSRESPPQTHGRVSASPISRPESAQYPKLSTPPRPGAVVARGPARAGMTPASCVPKKAVVRPPAQSPPVLPACPLRAPCASRVCCPSVLPPAFPTHKGMPGTAPGDRPSPAFPSWCPVAFQELCPFGHGAVPGPDDSREGELLTHVPRPPEATAASCIPAQPCLSSALVPQPQVPSLTHGWPWTTPHLLEGKEETLIVARA